MDRSRLGLFFLLIGLIMLVIFFGTDQSRDPQYYLFFLGAPLTAGGILVYWRHRKKPEPANRFSSVRKLMQASKTKGKPKPKKKLFGIFKL